MLMMAHARTHTRTRMYCTYIYVQAETKYADGQVWGVCVCVCVCVCLQVQFPGAFDRIKTRGGYVYLCMYFCTLIMYSTAVMPIGKKSMYVTNCICMYPHHYVSIYISRLSVHIYHHQNSPTFFSPHNFAAMICTYLAKRTGG